MPYATMEKYIMSQVRWWQQQKERIELPEKKAVRPFITISREYGCGGHETALKVIELINNEQKADPQWAAYDKQLLDKVMKDMGLSQSLTETLTNNARTQMTNLIQTTFSDFPPQVAVYRKLVETIRLLAVNGHVVVVGRAGNVITKDMENGFHVRLVASLNWKVDRMKTRSDLPRRDIEKTIIEKSQDRESFMREFVKFDVTDPHNYHLVINNTQISTEQVAKIIVQGMKAKGLI